MDEAFGSTPAPALDDLHRIGRIVSHDEIFAALAREAGGRPVAWHPTPGNAGDALIAAATRQLAERHRLAFDVVGEHADLSGRTVLFGGGGNLVPAYHDAERFLETHHARAERLIVLPHTVRGHEGLLSRLGGNVLVLCRDAQSHAHVSRHAPAARAALAPDLALSVDPSWLVLQNASVAVRLSAWGDPGWRRCFRTRVRIRAALAAARHRADGRPVPLLRIDVERASGDRRPRGLDVSRLYRGRCAHRASTLLAAETLVRWVRACGRVRTDRLHVAISAALTGTPVELVENAYGKLRAVFEMSIAGRFATVTWANEDHRAPEITEP